jgi:hypothetical protein
LNGDVTVLPLVGVQIFAPGSVAGVQLGCDVTTDTLACADFVVSATLVAVTVCDPAAAGAV